MPEEQAAAHKQGFDLVANMYRADLEQAAKDVEPCVTPDARTLLHHEAQYLTMLTKGTALSFICRSCLWAGDNSQWLKRATRWQFRCPRCKVAYRPHATEVGWVRASMCIIQADPASPNGKSITPCTWPSSKEEKVVNHLKELHARGAIGGSKDFIEGVAIKLDTLLRRYNMKRTPFFEHFDWTEEGMDRVDASSFPPSTYQHLKQNGFWGMQLQATDLEVDERGEQVELFDNWSEMLTVLLESYGATA
jgi:hypothetical protein